MSKRSRERKTVMLDFGFKNRGLKALLTLIGQSRKIDETKIGTTTNDV